MTVQFSCRCVPWILTKTMKKFHCSFVLKQKNQKFQDKRMLRRLSGQRSIDSDILKVGFLFAIIKWRLRCVLYGDTGGTIFSPGLFLSISIFRKGEKEVLAMSFNYGLINRDSRRINSCNSCNSCNSGNSWPTISGVIFSKWNTQKASCRDQRMN